MMTPARIFLSAALAMLLVGCSGRPVPVGHQLTTQQTMRTAAHWEALAADTAERINQLRASVAAEMEREALEKGLKFEPPPVLIADDAAFYVEPPDPIMPFARAFHQMLMTELIEKGMTLRLQRPGAYTVHYEVQPVYHTPGVPNYAPGTITGLGLGAGAIYGLAQNSAPAAAIVGGVITDVFASSFSEALRSGQYSEVLVTVSLVRGEMVLLRQARNYYVDTDELFQYAATVPSAPLASRRSGVSVTPASFREFRVVAE